MANVTKIPFGKPPKLIPATKDGTQDVASWDHDKLSKAREARPSSQQRQHSFAYNWAWQDPEASSYTSA